MKDEARMRCEGKKLKLVCVLFLGLLLLSLVGSVEAREISDMFGRKFAIPDRVGKVFSTGPSGTFLLYAIDPGMLAGLNFPVKGKDMKYMNKRLAHVPVIGWFGQGQMPNRETLLAVKPDVVFSSKMDRELSSKVNETLRTVNMPVVELNLDRLTDYPDAILRTGRMLGREKRAEKLSDYSRKTLAEAAAIVAALPRSKRVTVYYAEGPDGLSTECDTSRHDELIRLAGGMNVHRCVSRNPYGLEKVSLEQVLVYNPKVILTMEEGFYRKVFGDPLWRKISAVKEKKVYLIPREPINWFDRPPTFMRLIGLKWTLSRLYPGEYKVDIIREARDFYRLFLGVEVSDAEMRKIIYRQ